MKKNNIFIKTFLLSFIALIVLMVSFKKIRAVFPLPEIGSDKLVGFPQYFGYPLYFDNLFFLFIIISPAAIFLYFYFKKKKK